MISKAIFDSGVFIGFQDKNDQYTSQAVEILKNFRNKSILKIYVTDCIIVETINFLLKKIGYEKAKVMYDLLLNTEDIEIVYTDSSSMEKMKDIFTKYKVLSITDCSLIALSEKLKIKEIFSFDKHFDLVKGVRRLTAV